MKRKLVLFIQRLFTIPILEKMLIAFIEAFPSIRFSRKFAPQNFEYSDNEVRICKRYGINYQLHIQDYQSWLLYFYCDYDSSFDVLNFVKKGSVIIDVGGNIGQTAMMLSKQSGDLGKVIAFEPYPPTFKQLIFNLSLNKQLKNITAENIGLGENKGTLYMMEECTTNSGGNRIINPEEAKQKLVAVEVVTLDNYLLQKNIPKVDLIKIDVEGFEMKVLRGAKQTLLTQKPQLYIEIDNTNLEKQGDSSQKIIDFLLTLGYEIYDIPNMKKIIHFTEISPKSRDIYCKPLF